jgi:mannose/fructose/N-acetylgalactosamine-specific phosphotransferase system component IID
LGLGPTLGPIPMPKPTAKPLVAALGITLACSGLIWGERLSLMLAGAFIFIFALYDWLLSPVEKRPGNGDDLAPSTP